MSLLDNLPHTINLCHVTAAQGQYVSGKLTKGDAYLEDEPAWVQPADAKTVTEFASRDQVVTHVVYLQSLPSGIKLSDLVDVTYGPYSGYVMKVRAWREATAGLNAAWKLVCEVNREGQA